MVSNAWTKPVDPYIRDTTGRVVGYVLINGKAPPRPKSSNPRKGNGPVYNQGPFIRVKVQIPEHRWKGFRTEKTTYVERYVKIHVPPHGDLPSRDPDNKPTLRLYKKRQLLVMTDPDPDDRQRIIGDRRSSGALIYMDSKGKLRVNKEVWEQEGKLGIPVDVEYVEPKPKDMYVSLDEPEEEVKPVERHMPYGTYVPKHEAVVHTPTREEALREALERAAEKKQRGKPLTKWEQGMLDAQEILSDRSQDELPDDPCESGTHRNEPTKSDRSIP